MCQRRNEEVFSLCAGNMCCQHLPGRFLRWTKNVSDSDSKGQSRGLGKTWERCILVGLPTRTMLLSSQTFPKPLQWPSIRSPLPLLTSHKITELYHKIFGTFLSNWSAELKTGFLNLFWQFLFPVPSGTRLVVKINLERTMINWTFLTPIKYMICSFSHYFHPAPPHTSFKNMNWQWQKVRISFEWTSQCPREKSPQIRLNSKWLRKGTTTSDSWNITFCFLNKNFPLSFFLGNANFPFKLCIDFYVFE